MDKQPKPQISGLNNAVKDGILWMLVLGFHRLKRQGMMLKLTSFLELDIFCADLFNLKHKFPDKTGWFLGKIYVEASLWHRGKGLGGARSQQCPAVFLQLLTPQLRQIILPPCWGEAVPWLRALAVSPWVLFPLAHTSLKNSVLQEAIANLIPDPQVRHCNQKPSSCSW